MDSLQISLRELRTLYLENLPNRIGKIREIWSAQNEAGSWSTIERLTHTLAGSGATFGCLEVSELARKICTLSQAAAGAAIHDEKVIRVQVGQLLSDMESSCQHYIDHARKLPDPVAAPERVVPAPHAPLIYIVDDDTIYAENLAAITRASGYRVCVLDRIEALQQEIETRMPDVIVMDMMFAEGQLAGAEAISRMALHIPVIFLSVRSDTEARLAAVRAGAVHYFTKPVESARMIAMLDRLTCKPGTDSYRVMLVDDDAELSRFYATHLEAVGMRVTVFNNPVSALENLDACQPELIVLDVEMPVINGLELAALIRHVDAYSHVPIVFLTSDISIQTRLASMRLGADDYLYKPIEPAFLLESLRSRVARARIMSNGRLSLQSAMRDLEFMQSALDEHAIVAMTNMNGVITYANHKFVEVSGYSQQELLGSTHRMVKSDRMPADLYEDMWDTISKGRIWQGVLTNKARDGHTYEVSTTIVPKLDEAGLPEKYLSISTDVTAIKSLQRSLSGEQERLSHALEATGSGIWEWNISTGQVINTVSWRALLGYAADAEVSWPKLIHPDDFNATFAAWLDFIDGNSPSYESEHRMRNAKGEWDWVHEIGKGAEHDDQGHVLRIVGTIQIINERIVLQQQERQLQEKLTQAAKMESIGHLTAGIAHDFNNLLGGILGYAELSAEKLAHMENPGKLKNYMAQISSAGNRAKELIAQMLIFSHLSTETDEGEVPVTMLQPVIKEVVYLLRATIPSTIEVKYHIDEQDLRARIQPVHLHQILMNLAINARDAIGEYGKIDVRLARRALSDTCDACHQSFDGDYAVLTVQDSGQGIAEHLRKKIFDPFFTTKDVGKGTGMGLSVVHGIVHALGGHINVANAEEGGAVISILLPLAESKTDIEEESKLSCPSTEEGVLSGLRIMVVDDEHAMSSMLTELLSVHGAEVTVFNLPTLALAAFLHYPDSIDMVITDETMPGLSGLDMARAMLKVRHDLPIILCTGYSERVNAEIAQQSGLAGFLHKPLEIPKLLQLIQSRHNRLTEDE